MKYAFVILENPLESRSFPTEQKVPTNFVDNTS